MRKIIAAVFIFLSLISYSQWTNSFSKENEDAMVRTPTQPEPAAARAAESSSAMSVTPCPGQSTTTDIDCDCDGILDGDEENEDEICGAPNPSEPVPIDDYIPVLLLVSLGMIVYHTYRKKAVNQ